MEKWKLVRKHRKSIGKMAQESKIKEEKVFDKLIDLHILILPRELWLGRYQIAIDTALHL